MRVNNNKSVCNKCSDKLVADVNWRTSSQTYGKYTCNDCLHIHQKNYYHTDRGKEVYTRGINKYKKNNPHIQHKASKKWNKSIESGVYGIYDNDELIYIGQSTKPAKRISTHFSYKGIRGGKAISTSAISTAIKNGELQRDNLTYKMFEFIDDTKARKLEEQRLIQQYKPKYNSDYMYDCIQ